MRWPLAQYPTCSRDSESPFPAASTVCLTEVTQAESRRVMINMKRILLLLIFYSPLSTGGMIFTVSSVPFLRALDNGPTAAGEMAVAEPGARLWCCPFHFFAHRGGNCSHSDPDGTLTEASGQPHPVIQRPGAPPCFLTRNHTSCSSPSSPSLFHLHLVSSLS